jgi:hypothetical protein
LDSYIPKGLPLRKRIVEDVTDLLRVHSHQCSIDSSRQGLDIEIREQIVALSSTLQYLIARLRTQAFQNSVMKQLEMFFFQE